MPIAPFAPRPVSRDVEVRRARIAIAAATIGIAAALLAYAVSPGVRHAVGHAARGVGHAVAKVADRVFPDRQPVAPALPTESLSGSAVTLKTLKGHPALITFWAPSCAACAASAGTVETFAQRRGPRPGRRRGRRRHARCGAALRAPRALVVREPARRRGRRRQALRHRECLRAARDRGDRLGRAHRPNAARPADAVAAAGRTCRRSSTTASDARRIAPRSPERAARSGWRPRGAPGWRCCARSPWRCRSPVAGGPRPRRPRRPRRRRAGRSAPHRSRSPRR